MTVVAGSLGIHCKLVHRLEQKQARTNAGEEAGVKLDHSEAAARKHCEDFSIDQTELNNVVTPALRDLLICSGAINSTAFEDHVRFDSGHCRRHGLCSRCKPS